MRKIQLSLYKKNRHGTARGFTLIEGLVLIVIISIAVMAFYRTYLLAMRHALETKYRTASVQFAAAQMEILRNTPYQNLKLDPSSDPAAPSGAIIGLTSGDGIAYSTVTTTNDIRHEVITDVRYVDDPEDGRDAADENNSDYKKVTVTVAWGSGIRNPADTSRRVSLTSYFVPPFGNESMITKGAISAHVVDSAGVPVVGASVAIKTASGGTVAGHSAPILTSDTGTAIFLNLNTGVYTLTITKDGSETVATLPAYPTTSYYPLYVHPTVVVGLMTTLTFVVNPNPHVTFTAVDPLGEPLFGRHFTFSGGRIVGFLPEGNVPKYVNDNLTTTTSSDGDLDIEMMADYTASGGLYTFTLTDTGYVLWKEVDSAVCGEKDDCGVCQGDATVIRDSNPLTAEVSGTFVSDVVVVDKSVDGILVRVTDGVTAPDSPYPLVGATVRVQDATDPAPPEAYDRTRTTDRYGMVYFPVKNAADDSEGAACEIVPLEKGKKYNVTVTAEGFAEQTQDVTVDGLQDITIAL